MSSNFRALCAELTDELHGYASANPHHDSDELVARARAALAEPEPPADGEVAELVSLVQEFAADNLQAGFKDDAAKLTRAADLLERLMPQPVAIIERLPEPNIKVLAHYFNDHGKGRTVCAIWVPAKSRSDSYGDDDFTEYDEETDNFYWPEGWYETIENWDDLGFVKIDEGEVVYWQPLPKWPSHALPLPSQEPEHLAPQPVLEGPSDEELLELMPQQFRDDLATVSRLASYGTPVEPGIYRVSLNTGALDYARAVLARWGRP